MPGFGVERESVLRRAAATGRPDASASGPGVKPVRQAIERMGFGNKPRRLWRAADENGAQLVEFALVLPILAALLLGIITGGIALNSSVSMNNAARESARFGATLPVAPSMGDYLQDVADVAIRSATGDLDDGVPGRVVCVAYVYPDGGAPEDQTTRLMIDPAGTATTTVGTRCFDDGRPDDERRVQVSLQRTSDLIVVFWQRTLNLDASSVARYERAP